jgi:L-threonylcarbamoyladenylate synthase
MLRDLDRTVIDGIAVAPIADDGIGAAINDRLRRAAAPRNDPAAAACRDRV